MRCTHFEIEDHKTQITLKLGIKRAGEFEARAYLDLTIIDADDLRVELADAVLAVECRARDDALEGAE